MRGGETVFYFYGNDGFVYSASLSDNEGYVLIRPGDRVTFLAEATAVSGIRRVITYRIEE